MCTPLGPDAVLCVTSPTLSALAGVSVAETERVAHRPQTRRRGRFGATATKVCDEELTDALFVFERRVLVKILVASALNLPYLLAASCAREKGARFVDVGIRVLGARDKQDRFVDVRDGVDRPQPLRIDPDSRRDKLDQRRRNGAPQEAEWSQPGMEAISNSIIECRIYRLQHERVDTERSRTDQCGRPSHGHADHPNALAGHNLTQECERGLGVEALELTESDVLARALPVGLEVRSEDREPRPMKEAGALEHRRAVAAHPM